MTAQDTSDKKGRSRRDWVDVWTLTISAATLAFSGCVLLATLPSVSGLLDRVANNVVGPHTLNDENIALTVSRIGSVRASSFRENYTSSAVAYPQNVIDGKAETAWSECKGAKNVHGKTTRRAGGRFLKEDSGSGGCPSSGLGSTHEGSQEWIELELTSRTQVKSFRIRSGYQQDNASFFRNPRPADITVSDGAGHPYLLATCTPKGAATGTCRLADDFGYQTFAFSRNVGIETIRFTIVSCYPGEAFPAKFIPNPLSDENHRPLSDTSISDIQLIPVTRG